jgi:pimeloyl-ACP methyl ester carboxylesterase
MDSAGVLIKGESYGGYVALSVAADYADRIMGAISTSGPSNLGTHLEKTDIPGKTGVVPNMAMSAIRI